MSNIRRRVSFHQKLGGGTKGKLAFTTFIREKKSHQGKQRRSPTVYISFLETEFLPGKEIFKNVKVGKKRAQSVCGTIPRKDGKWQGSGIVARGSADASHTNPAGGAKSVTPVTQKGGRHRVFRPRTFNKGIETTTPATQIKLKVLCCVVLVFVFVFVVVVVVGLCLWLWLWLWL